MQSLSIFPNYFPSILLNNSLNNTPNDLRSRVSRAFASFIERFKFGNSETAPLLGGIDEARAPLDIRRLNLVTDGNAVTRAGMSTAGIGMQAAGVSGVSVAAFTAAIGSLQLVQGITLIWLAIKLLPVSYEELCEASKVKTADPERYSVALRNFMNHVSLMTLGVLFGLLGSVVLVGWIGVKLGLSAAALGGLVIGAAVLGGLLSAVCVVRGIHLICRSQYNLQYINKFQTELFQKIANQDWDGAIALVKLDESDELYCERRIGRKAKDELVGYLSLLKQQSNLFVNCHRNNRDLGIIGIKKELVRILCEGVYEKKLEQQMLRKIGALMFVAGILGVIASAATKGAGAVAAGVVMGTTLTANALFTLMEAGWVGVDESVVFEKIQKQMKKYTPVLPNPLPQQLEQDESLEKFFIEATGCSKDNIDQLLLNSLEKSQSLEEYEQIRRNIALYPPKLLELFQRQKLHFSEHMQYILKHVDRW